MKKHFINNRKKTFLLLFYVFYLISFTTAQEKSRIAVLPFSPVEVSASEAKVVTSLFETALVKTGVYSVIEQNQINEILNAQAFSLSGCTDDSCAIEVGELLSAEMIILGEISKLGDLYIANAKIIDVGLGKNVNADSVSARNIEEMTNDKIKLLANQLAGLTYTKGAEVRIADSFGEIFIETEPSGAEIFINGMRRGTSPFVAAKVPFGEALITARKDTYFGEGRVNVRASDLVEIKIPLRIIKGRVFIKCDVKDVDVYFDSKKLGNLDSGLFKDLPSGEHQISLINDDVFWDDTVIVEENKTITIDAYPVAFGYFVYDIVNRAEAELNVNGKKEIISGKGKKRLPVGDYEIKITGSIYKDYNDSFSITKGESLRYKPKLIITDKEEFKRQTEEQNKIRISYIEKIKNISNRIERASSEEEKAIIIDARKLYEDIFKIKDDFPELAQQSRKLLIKTISIRVDTLEALLSKAERSKAAGNVLKIATISIGALSLGASAIIYYFSSKKMDEYNEATITADAIQARKDIRALEIAGGVCVGVGVAGLSIGIPLSPDITKIKNDISLEMSSLLSEKAILMRGEI